MDDRNKKIFLYVSFFIPLIILFSEISLAIFTNVAGIKLPNKQKFYKVNHLNTFDLITGTNRYKPSNKDFQNKNSFINRHGLIRTFRSTNKNNLKNVKGIAILGNSVALGYPVTHQGIFEKSFVNLLEKDLIKKNKSIDIVNLSNHGFNSWHENVQLAKYFNSNNNFYDLPNIKLVASLGGIQDFWGFISLLKNKDQIINNFHNANGLMSLRSKNEALFFNSFDKATKGNMGSGLYIFLKSILRNIKKNSYSNGYLMILKEQINNINNSNSTLENVYTKSESIDEVVSKKLNISMEEYIQKKSIFIESVVRNYRSMIAINPEGKFLFVYLPTKFGFSNEQRNISKRFLYKNLNVSDLHILENDYRLTLINSLNKLENIKTYNLTNKGSLDWFHDESHYSIKGHKEISKILFPIFSNLLESLN